jgi:hypothetical protein
MAGRVDVEIADQDLNAIRIELEPGLTITGRVTTDTGIRPVAGFRVSLRMDPAIHGVNLPVRPEDGLVAGDGSFSFSSVPAGDYRIAVNFPSDIRGLYVRSVRFGPIDVLKEPLPVTGQSSETLEIVVGTKPGSVDGIVVNSDNVALPAVTAVLVPSSEERTRMDLYRAVSTDASGRFQLRDLAPGDYKLFAWRVVEDGVWTDPAFLQNYDDLGTPVRITEGSIVQAQTTLIQ